MRKIALIGALAVMLCTANHAVAEEQLSTYRPLSNLDAMSSGESAHEVFRGQQWAVYQLTANGQCSGYALANVDTKFYIKIDPGSGCNEGPAISLAQVSGQDYRLSIGNKVGAIDSIELTKQ